MFQSELQKSANSKLLRYGCNAYLNPIQSNPIQYNTIQYNTIQYNIIVLQGVDQVSFTMKISRFSEVNNIMQPQFKTCVVLCLYIILCLVHCIVLQGVYYLSSTLKLAQAKLQLDCVTYIYIKRYVTKERRTKFNFYGCRN